MAVPVQAQSCQPCILALDPHVNQSFNAGNNAQINLKNCGLRVNSDSSTAMYLTGSAHVKASAVQVVGGYSLANGGASTPTPTSGASASVHPFAIVPPPTVSACL